MLLGVDEFYRLYIRLHKRIQAHFRLLGEITEDGFSGCVIGFLTEIKLTILCIIMKIYGSYAGLYKRVIIFFKQKGCFLLKLNFQNHYTCQSCLVRHNISPY